MKREQKELKSWRYEVIEYRGNKLNRNKLENASGYRKKVDERVKYKKKKEVKVP